MSAWRNSPEDIGLLVSIIQNGPTGAGHGWSFHYYFDRSGRSVRPHDYDELERIGRQLDADNEASILARYPGDDAFAEVGRPVFTIKPATIWPTLTPGEAFKLVDCYDYQSCEASTWEASESNAICEALRKAISRCVAGYDDAHWGWDRDKLAERKRADGTDGMISLSGLAATMRRK